MAADGKSSSGAARCLSLPIALALLGATWGCSSSVPAQADMDEAAKARVQAAHEATKAAKAKAKTRKADELPSAKRKHR